MSCTLMYQPYAMSYSSSCERPSASSERQKLFKFPHIPSPPDSSHSGASTYSGHSSSASSTHIPSLGSGGLSLSLAPHHSPGGRSSSSSRRPITPSSGPSATITSPGGGGGSHLSQSHHGHHITLSHSAGSSSTPGNSNRSSSSTSSSHTLTSGQHQGHHHGGGGSSGSELQIHHSSASSSSASASATSTSQLHHETHSANQPGPSGSGNSGGGGGNSGGTRAQYLTANCVVYENYDGEATRVVDEHFSRSLSAAYVSDKPSKSLPMTTRNLPPSFFNSAYQPPPKPLTSYGATGPADFYGSAMDYGSALPALAHHHQTDPWHYPLTSHHHHQPYHHHHRAADLAYPPMASTSRFNPTPYGSFLFPGAAATSAAAAAGRFAGIPGPSQCGVKGEGGHWGAGGRYHPHESTWTDFQQYSAAAAHYSNMTAGLDFESHYLQSS